MKRIAWLLLIALLLAPAPGRAQSADEALAALASASFDRIRQGVEHAGAVRPSARGRDHHALQAGPTVMRAARQGAVHQDR